MLELNLLFPWLREKWDQEWSEAYKLLKEDSWEFQII